MAEQVTMMKLTVDLNCAKCCKKVKKALAKISQITDQVFDESSNTVTIKVVCCSPEKIMHKICSKGGGAIKSIEIIQPTIPQIPQKSETPKPEPESEPEPKPVATVPVPAGTMLAVPEPVGPKPDMMMPAYMQGQVMSMYNGPNYEAQTQSYSRPIYDSWGGGPPQAQGRPYMPFRDDYFSQQNPQACSIM